MSAARAAASAPAVPGREFELPARFASSPVGRGRAARWGGRPTVLILLLAIALGSWGSFARAQVPDPARARAARRGGEVHGSILAGVKDTEPIPLRGFRVQLRNKETGTIVETAETDDAGRYRFHWHPQGEYRVSWEAPDWAPPGRDAEPIRVSSGTRIARPIVVHPADQARGTIEGVVEFPDGTSPAFTDEHFAIEQAAVVHVIRGKDGPQVGEARANGSGEFVIPGLPREDLTVKAGLVQRRMGTTPPSPWTTVPGVEEVRAVKSGEFDGSSDGEIFLRLKLGRNRPPRPVSVTATADGKAVSSARPGQTVLCTASTEDPDSRDVLKYAWKTASCSYQSGQPWFSWTLPDYEGPQTAHVLVADGKGRFARGSITLPVVARAGVPGKSMP